MVKLSLNPYRSNAFCCQEFHKAETGTDCNVTYQPATQRTVSQIYLSAVKKLKCENKYKTKAHNFLFDFVPKELIYLKKSELQLTTAIDTLCTLDGDVIKFPAHYVCQTVLKGYIQGLTATVCNIQLAEMCLH
jgi:hypothetical protein